MIEIEALRKRNRPEQITVTEHARQRLAEREITVSDVLRCIETGEIIRQYEDDKPFPSCLVLGTTMEGKPIHAVVSQDDAFIHLITAYYPDQQLWETDLKRRRERSK